MLRRAGRKLKSWALRGLTRAEGLERTAQMSSLEDATFRMLQYEVSGGRPSFERRVEESMQEYRLHRDSLRSRFITACNNKLQAYRLVDHIVERTSIELACPEVYSKKVRISDVAPDSAGASFILKPLSGAANRGVFCIERRGDQFFDSVRGATYDWAGLCKAYLDERESLPERSRYSRQTVVEEWIRDDVRGPIPLDYRMYCFWGRVGLIQQRDCNGGKDPASRRFRYYDGGWNDLGAARRGDTPDLSLVVPPRAEEAVSIAGTVSRFVPLPFIRVDLYITPRGVRFGEFTPHPGSYSKYKLHIDTMMGRMWEESAWRLARSRFPQRDEIVRVLEGGAPEPLFDGSSIQYPDPW